MVVLLRGTWVREYARTGGDVDLGTGKMFSCEAKAFSSCVVL